MKPVLQALILAERVYTTIDGRSVIAGTFNAIATQQRAVTPNGPISQKLQPPKAAGSPYAYLSLTDVCDNTEITLQFVNLNKNKVLFHSEFLIESKDRLATHELIIPLPQLPITENGVYAFEVICENEIIGSHRIMATFQSDSERE